MFNLALKVVKSANDTSVAKTLLPCKLVWSFSKKDLLVSQKSTSTEQVNIVDDNHAATGKWSHYATLAGWSIYNNKTAKSLENLANAVCDQWWHLQ